MQPLRGVLAAIALIASAGASHAQAAVRYRITMLAPIDGIQSQPIAINNHGLVVGHAADESVGSYPVAVLWDDRGNPTYLTGEGNSGAFVTAVNDDGLIAGASDSFAGTVNSHGGFIAPDGFTPNPIGDRVGPSDMDSAGRLACTIIDEAFIDRVAGVWHNGVTTILGSLDPAQQSFAHAMNDAGIVVGISDTAQGPIYATKWDSGRVINLGGIPTADPAWFWISTANDINENGLIVGEAYVNSFTTQAAQWPDAAPGPQLLELPEGFSRSQAEAVNDRGHIVGWAQQQLQTTRAVLWRHGRMTDLNTLIDPDSGWRLQNAVDINNRGQIIGFGEFDDLWVGFRLDPLCDADLDASGTVDVDDLNEVLAHWSLAGQAIYTNGDADGDRDCDVDDLNAVLASWGCADR